MKSLFVAILLLLSASAFGQSFATQSYLVGSGPAQLIVADFNGDHVPDIATVNQNSNTVSILINNGDGTFRPHMEFATGPSPVGLAAVDWNKDGKMDLVVVNGGADAAHSVSILIGNGDGTFKPHQDIPGAPNATSITAGDFNHDGNPDIATSSNNPVNAVYVSLGNGSGGVLAQKVTTGFGQKSQPGESRYQVTKIVWADFNRDGKDDLYYIQCCGGFDVEIGAWGVLIGNGDGTFTDHVVSTVSVPRDIVSTDINQDGLSDAIIDYVGCHTPCAGSFGEINNGNGTFSGAGGVSFSENAPGGVAFPVESDGLKDFVAVGTDIFGEGADPSKTWMYISHQNADGTFANPVLVALAAPTETSTAVITGDFNHDGKIDVAFINGTSVFVSLNTTPTSACIQRTTDHTVTLCHPEDGAVGPSPAHIVAHATSSTPVDATQIYLDFKLVFQAAGGNLDTSLPLSLGNHRLEVKSWSQGKNFRNDFFLTAANGGSIVQPCTENTNFTVNICSPGQNANVNSPVNVVAAAKSSVKITAMQIYVDGKLVFSSPNVTQINTDVAMAKGAHRATVKAWDSSGRNFSSTRNITVQ